MVPEVAGQRATSREGLLTSNPGVIQETAG